MEVADIVYEGSNGKSWVFKDSDSYVVMMNGITYSSFDSAYSLDEDGKSIAIARCKYLDGRL